MCSFVMPDGSLCKIRTGNKLCHIHDYEMDECVVCFEHKKLYVLPECSHRLCKKCSRKMTECPLCRKTYVHPTKHDKCIELIATYTYLKHAEETSMFLSERVLLYNMRLTVYEKFTETLKTIKSKYKKKRMKKFFLNNFNLAL